MKTSRIKTSVIKTSGMKTSGTKKERMPGQGKKRHPCQQAVLGA